MIAAKYQYPKCNANISQHFNTILDVGQFRSTATYFSPTIKTESLIGVLTGIECRLKQGLTNKS